MSSSFWSIDAALHLHPVHGLPAQATPLNRPEQLVDTLVLRNLETFCDIFCGCSGKFLFHSTEYWGPFDIGCLLADGSLGAFETKSKSVNRKGFDKFCRDIRTVNKAPDEYIDDLDASLIPRRLVPVLLVPSGSVHRVESWLADNLQGDSVSALLGSYQFFTDNVAYPRWFSTTVLHEFPVPLRE